MKKRWKCTVCGYIHVGNEPPATCPICGADRSKFILLNHEKSHFIHEMAAAFKLHPVLAHFPNGLMPTAALFLVLFLFTQNTGFESTAFWLVLALTVVVPASIGTGLHDWYKYFGGQRSPIFAKKICLALTLLVLGLATIYLRYGQPDLLVTAGWQRWLYLLCLIGMLGCVALLGHFGSLLAVRVAQNQSQTYSDNPASNRGENDAWLRSIVTLAPDAILAADTSGVIRLWNHGAERIFAVPADEAIGQSLDLIIPEDLRQRHWNGWAKVMRSGKSRYGEDELLRVPAIRGDGNRFSAEFSIFMLKGKDGEVAGVAAILRDVSEQWEHEKELKAQLMACQDKRS